MHMNPAQLHSCDRPSHKRAIGRSALRIGAPAAFTLVEVILAIGIATGLLIIALTFYRQVADLRGQILTEAERFAAIRLVMDRLAADLRTAQPMTGAGNGFVGDSGALSFPRSTLSLRNPGTSLGEFDTDSDLVRVSFTTVKSTEGTNTVVVGFNRLEEPLPAKQTPSVPVGAVNHSDTGVAATNHIEEPLTDVIRFVRFRYWDGNLWQAGWTNTAPPLGVEVVLGTDPLPDDATPETYPFEQFRRVIFLPAGFVSSRPGTESSVSSIRP